MRTKAMCFALGLSVLLGGCASSDSFIAKERRNLDVPEIDGSADPVPLRVGVYVDRAVLSAMTYGKHSDRVTRWGTIGGDVLNAFSHYAPKVFAQASLAPGFPDPALANGNVDAILAVEYAMGEWNVESIYDDHLFNDVEIVVAVYTVDGRLIERYSAFGSAKSKRNTWSQADSVRAMVQDRAVGVRPAVRAALLQFPTARVLGHLARHDAEIRKAATILSEADWAARRAAFRAEIQQQQARTPVGAEDGVELNRRTAQAAALAAGMGTAVLGQMSAQGIGNPVIGQATALYLQHTMGKDESFKQGLAAGQIATGLIALGGRGGERASAASGGGGSAGYCQELLELANKCKVNQGRMASMQPINQPSVPFTPGTGAMGGAKRPAALPSGGGNRGQAGSFNDCYNNYINAYNAACR